MKYKIIEEEYTARLAEEVEPLMKEGWRPIGGPFFDGDGYCQALILVEPEPEPPAPTEELIKLPSGVSMLDADSVVHEEPIAGR